MYKVYVGIVPGELENVKRICTNMKAKMEREGRIFRYTVGNTSIPGYECVLVIIGKERKEVQSLAGWFIHKCTEAKFPNYFWTRWICENCGYNFTLKRKKGDVGEIESCPKCGEIDGI